MTVYRSPGLDDRRGLTASLTRVAASDKQRPLERQLTELLAWCLSCSQPLAREFVAAFVSGDATAEDALAHATRFRIETEVPLATDSGHVFPDLSICAEDRALQLLVEVKFGSDFHSYALDETTMSQPDYYAVMWERDDPWAVRARVCRVGTLTRSGNAPRVHAWRCRDLSWLQIGELLRTHGKDPTVGVVSADLASYIEEIETPGPTPQAAADFLEAWRPLVSRGLKAVANRLSATQVSGSLSSGRDHPYLGGFCTADVDGAPVRFWLHLSPARTRYAVVGHQDGLYLVAEEATCKVPLPALPAIALSFDRNVDGRGHWCYRRFLSTEDLVALPEAERLDLLLETLAAPISTEGAP